MIDFPITPTLGQQYTSGDRTWVCIKIAPGAIWDMVPVSTSDADAAAASALEAADSADAAEAAAAIYDDMNLAFVEMGTAIDALSAEVIELGSGTVTTAALAAADGVDLLAYAAADAQSILDNALPMQSYTALRAYTGRALGVRLTSAAIAGTFQLDAADTTSTDNGGTIIVDGAGRRWKRLYFGAVYVRWFGADATGVSDSTSAFNAAIAYLASLPTSAGVGVGWIVVDKGIFLLDGEVTFGASVAGLVIQGAGDGATLIKRTVDSGNVFSFSAYSRIRFQDMAFSHVTGTAYTTWTNVLFSLNGTGGGNNFQVVNCRSEGFGNIVKHNASPAANEDTNFFQNCRFSNFKIFLYSLSSQAVINSFRGCTFFGTCEAVFHINGFGCTHLDTCNIVVSGKVYDVYGGGPTATYVNTNCKFEFWPQGGAVGTTQLIKMNAAANVYFSFRGGGFTSSTGPDAAVNQLELMLTSGQILFDGGIWDNRIKIKTFDSMPTSVFGTAVINGYTKFSGCTQSPSPANVTFDNSGVSPSYAGVVWENCNDRTNLCLTGIANGAAFNSTVPAESVINRNTFTGSPSGGVIMNGATPTTFAVPHHGQLAFLRAVRVLVHSQGNVASGLISVFADAAKTISIATLAITAGVSTTPKIYEVTIPADTVVSEGVFVEIKNNNGVFVYGRVYVETMSI